MVTDDNEEAHKEYRPFSELFDHKQHTYPTEGEFWYQHFTGEVTLYDQYNLFVNHLNRTYVTDLAPGLPAPKLGDTCVFRVYTGRNQSIYKRPVLIAILKSKQNNE